MKKKIEDYQKRKSELESEYEKLRNKFETGLARYGVFINLEIIEEKYKHIKEGVKDGLIPVFLKLCPLEGSEFYLLSFTETS